MCSVLLATPTWLDSHQYLALWIEGIALLLIFAWDRWDSHQQHKQTLAQMGIMQRQADLIDGQTAVLKESVSVAKDGAEAAKANAEAARLNAEAAKNMLELTVSKERARLRVEVKALDLSIAGYLAHTVEYTVRLYGTTEARVIESGAEAYLHNSAEPPTDKNSLMMPIGLEQVLSPQSPTVTKSAFLMPKIKLDKADVDGINERKSFVHFRGFIKYRDVFERERETRFQYLWNVTDLPNFGGGPFSYWTRSGAASDNSET
jgi:hypothetical protein